MVRTSTKTLFSITAALLLGGCTITTYKASDPPAPKPASQPKPTTTSATRKPPPRIFRPGKPSTTTGGSTSDVTPRISSPIIFGNGTGGAFTGHAYVIPEDTTKMPDLSNLVPFATFYTNSFQIQSQEFSGGFPGALVQEDWFAIRYEGAFSVSSDGSREFKVVSDDGAILYIDGEKVVDNDGKHTAKTATGTKNLKVGKHQLRLDYFQAQKGPVALAVSLVENGKESVLVGTK